MGTAGERIETQAMRYVVQLGFGQPVQQVMFGPEIKMKYTMCRCQGKFPTAFGWPSGPLPGAIITGELERVVPLEAISEIQPRHNDTATFLLHSSYLSTLLKSSGRNSVFWKEVQPANEYLLLWLEEGTTLPDACKLAEHDDCFGVVRKGTAAVPRFAIRFQSQTALKTFADANHLYDMSSLGRWKVTGSIDAAVGTFGMLAWLTERSFQDVEILYVGDGQGVFLASQPGDISPGYFIQSKTKRQVHFKAVNSVAKEQAKAKNQQARSSAAPSVPKSSQSERAQKQHAFLHSLQNASSPQAPKIQSKRPIPQGTGVTPDGKRKDDKETNA